MNGPEPDFRIRELPFRLGTTSYIIPDDILPNVRFLSGKVRDIELVLFEAGEGGNNLPSPDLVEELRSTAAEHDLTWTVHLPLDLRLCSPDGECEASLEEITRVIALTRPLGPRAYVLHLEGRDWLGLGEGAARKPTAELRAWQDRAVRSLEEIAERSGMPEELIAVENLEGYPTDFLDPVLERTAVSCCIDIGHLWKDGHDAVSFLDKALSRTRVIHWHGIGERDHQSLAFHPDDEIDAVFHRLLRERYAGVLTLEVFNENDFVASTAVLKKSGERYGKQ